MERKVTVLTPHGRRQVIHVTINTTLLQILETASQKHGFDANEYCLKFHNKEVSLSQMFRFSGLPNNCVLEMELAQRARVESNVFICIQLSDGSRKQAEFRPDLNLWQILEHLCANEITQYKSPVVIYMRSEIIGMEQLSKTTLKSLGIIEGRAIMRLIDKQPEELKTQANVYIPPAEKPKPVVELIEKPSTSSAKPSANAGGFSITSNLIKNLKRTAADIDKNEGIETTEDVAKSTKNELDKPTEPIKYDWGTGVGYTMHRPQSADSFKHDEDAESRDEPVVNVIGPRYAVLFSLDATQKHIENLPDSFFELTVSDLRLVLRDLKKTSAGTESTPMLTGRLRELERHKVMLNKLGQYKDCVLRIQFPDRFVLQGIFRPHETIADVEKFVREFIVHSSEDFQLFTIPPKTVLEQDKTLLELNFVPNSVLHFAFVDDPMSGHSHNFIKPQYIEQLTSEEGALYAVQKFGRRVSGDRATTSNTVDE